MHEISSLSLIKNLGYIPVLFLGISTESIGILTLFIFIDTALGAIRVGVIHGTKYIKSYKAVSGIISKLCVLLVPLLMALAGKAIGVNLTPLATGTINVLIMAHLYSIISNVYCIHIKKDVEEFDAVSWILRRVQYVIEKMIKNSEPTLKVPLKDHDDKD